MLRAVRGFLLAGLVAGVAGQSSAQQLPQRRSAIDSLGLGQPESVKAILLLYSGKNISKAKADELAKPVGETAPTILDAKISSVATYAEFDREQARGTFSAS